jgi:hypothetical protein
MLLAVGTSVATMQSPPPQQGWPYRGQRGDAHSPLTDITPENVARWHRVGVVPAEQNKQEFGTR